MNDFKARLDIVLAGRKLHPWAKGLGFSRGAAENMGKGVVPGSEILAVIMRQENVSLTWLATGRGVPFMVHQCKYADDLTDALNLHFSDAWWDINLYTDGTELFFELELPTTYDFKGKTIEYTQREWLAGPLDKQVLACLEGYMQRRFDKFMENSKKWQLVTLPAELMDKLSSGYISPYTLHSETSLTKPLNRKGLDNIQWHEPLLNLFINYQSTDAENLSIPLLRAVLKMVRQLADDETEYLSPEEEAKIAAATYKYAIKKNLKPDDLDPDLVQGMMDML